MASKRQRGEVWEYTVKRTGVLPKPLYLTFRSEAEGDAYCRNLEALLDKGIVPPKHQTQSTISTIADLIREYERDAHPSAKDRSTFGPTLRDHGTYPLHLLNAAWVDAWISGMKRVEKLAPASIRARVGALARATDYGVRKGHLTLPDHPFRSLPDGYSQYTQADKAVNGGRVDVERDRRLEPGELERILEVIDSGVIPRKQRPLVIDHKKELRLLVVLAVETAMRLREMYTLSTDQVDVYKRTVFLNMTKNGTRRQVPLSSVALAAVKDYLTTRSGLLLPWWDGEQKSLVKTSDYLSKLFGSVAEAAGCVDLKFHDLRHHAISTFFERTTLSETEIMKISGHKSHQMLMRYTHLRGNSMAEKLWTVLILAHIPFGLQVFASETLLNVAWV